MTEQAWLDEGDSILPKGAMDNFNRLINLENGIITWIDNEINSSGNRLNNARLNGNKKRELTSMIRIKTLREIKEKLSNFKA